jgi:hypothetical protein
MRNRQKVAWIAAMVTGLALLTAAAAPATSGDVRLVNGPSIETVELFEQPMDSRGRPTGPRVRVNADEHRPDAVAVAAAAGRRSTSGRTVVAETRAAQAASGCKTVWVARTRTSTFGSLLWRYQQDKYFCWSYPRVTTAQANAYPCCLDPFWRWAGTIGSSGWYFARFGNSRGGHYSFRQGKFQQVVLGQVTSTATPWTKLWVHGDGSWSYATDVSG